MQQVIMYKAYRHCKYKWRMTSDSAEVSTKSIEAVVELKKGSDEPDKFYVYEINNSAMNNLPDFVVKSGSTVLQFAIDMDQMAQNQFCKMRMFILMDVTVGAKIL